MLGHGKIPSETPNVIDLGDDAPARPSRPERASYSDNPEQVPPIESDHSDHRQRFLLQFKRTTKLKLLPENKFTDNVDDDGKDDDQHPRPMSDVELSDVEDGISLRGSVKTSMPTSPSLENARNFAQTLLAETERRRTERFHDELPVRSNSMKWPRRGRRQEFQGLRTPAESSPEHIGQLSREGILKAQIQRRRLVARIFLVLLAVSMIVGGVIVANRARQSSHSLQSSDSDRLKATMEALIERGVTARILFTDHSSPQYKAAHWIAMDDAEDMDVPTDSDSDANAYRFVQRYVLAVLYFSWDGPRWTKRLNFVTNLHECSWFESVPDENGQFFAVGVTCDERLQVRNLFIPSNNLKGKIPREISHLTKLDFLSLKHNSLSGTIPPYLNELSGLDFLDLNFNSLTGTIPSFLGELSHLEVLGLSHNQLVGRVPASLGSLTLLLTLAIDENILTGDLSPVASMTKLQYLYAGNNKFKGRLDGGLLANLTELVEVDLSGNALQASSVPAYLFSRPSLRVLDLHANQIAGTLPSAIAENTALEYLSLRKNYVKSRIPSQIYHLRKLTHLDLEDNAFTGTLPARELAQMTSLSYLFLGKNPLHSGTIPSALHTLKSMRELSLNSLQLTGTIPTWLEDFSKLKLLDLRSNSLTGSLTLDFSKLPELSYLMINDNFLNGHVPENLGSDGDLFVVALHHNNITGNAAEICQKGVQLLTTDCDDINCPCCKTCCDSGSCYQDLLWDELEYSQGTWEENYVRSTYAFNPHILYDSSKKDTKGHP